MVSIAIGNGLTDPKIQYEYYPDMVINWFKRDQAKVQANQPKNTSFLPLFSFNL